MTHAGNDCRPCRRASTTSAFCRKSCCRCSAWSIMLLDPLVDEAQQPEDSGLHRAGRRAGRDCCHALSGAVSRAGDSGTWCRWTASASSSTFVITAIAAVVILSFVRVHGGAADSRRRILRPDSVRRGRHVPDVVGGRTGADLHRAGNFFDLDLRPGRIPAARGHQQRSRR